MPKRGSCGSLLQGCRLSKQNPSVALTIESSARIKSSYRSVLSRCPTSRDFVPWRFLDAGQLSARIFHCCRRPKTSTGAAQEQAVVGETPNLAAHLQALAEPGAVVIAAGTRRLTGGLFD